ncbi:MAG: hypothetical protein REI11_14190, partial [Patulibacter sp.]|nr:hypothetical protein [Patulibacter sp.]
MPPAPRSPRLLLLLLAVVFAAPAGLVGLLASPTAALADSAPVVYPIPGSEPSVGDAIVTDPAGQVWFTTDDTNVVNAHPQPRIGRLDPANATAGGSTGFSLFPTPAVGSSCCATYVRSLAFDNARSQLWFVRSDGVYGWADPSAVVAGTSTGMHYATAPAGLWGVAVDQNSHAVWMAENSSGPYDSGGYPGDRIARTDSALGLTELPNISLASSRWNLKPIGPSVGPNGEVWFAESDPGQRGYRIARVGGGSGYDEYSLNCVAASPCSGSNTGQGPTDTAVASDGTVWFIDRITNTLGRFVPSSGQMTQYSLTSLDPSLSAAAPRQLRFAADGSLWVAVGTSSSSSTGANAILKVTSSAAGPVASVFHTGAYSPYAVAPSVTGDVWFTATDSSGGIDIVRLVQVTTPGKDVGGITVPDGGTPGATPTPTPPAGPA